jgi:hypothetical protein
LCTESSFSVSVYIDAVIFWENVAKGGHGLMGCNFPSLALKPVAETYTEVTRFIRASELYG